MIRLQRTVPLVKGRHDERYGASDPHRVRPRVRRETVTHRVPDAAEHSSHEPLPCRPLRFVVAELAWSAFVEGPHEPSAAGRAVSGREAAVPYLRLQEAGGAARHVVPVGRIVLGDRDELADREPEVRMHPPGGLGGAGGRRRPVRVGPHHPRMSRACSCNAGNHILGGAPPPDPNRTRVPIASVAGSST